MSVLGVVNSPLLAKRHFDEAEATEAGFGGKRTRTAASPARCVPFVASGLGVHAVPPTTIAALLALFPGMDERAVTNVLAECGNNIDAAIKRLGELRLSVGNHAAADQQEAPPSTPPPPSSQVAAAAAAAAAEAAEAATPAGPTTAEQWVEVLVGEMSAARDLSDARTRAAGFLRQFEAFVARYVRQQQQGASTSAVSPEPGAGGVTPGAGGAAAAAGSASASHQSAAQRAAKLAEENALLKKAVQIQHRQLQEKSAAEGEVASLKAMLAQYQEQVRTLQLTNYSLSLHLQKATNSDALGHHHRGGPDVF